MIIAAIIIAFVAFLAITGGYEFMSRLIAFGLIIVLFTSIFEYAPFSPFHGHIFAAILRAIS